MSAGSTFHYDWPDLAFASKRPLNALSATFIAAPRAISAVRLKRLFKHYLPQGNIILGLAQEDYVLGLEGQPAFRMLALADAEPLVRQVNQAQLKSTVTLLSYHQRDLPHILEKLNLKQAAFINGSWYHAFHFRPEYYILNKRRIKYEMLSPFIDEAEARAYAEALPQLPANQTGKFYTEAEMLAHATAAAKYSLDSAAHQVGVALGRRADQKGATSEATRYELLATAFNSVVPYQTYAWHHGSTREQHFSPPGDQNHYDTNHAEIELMLKVVRDKIELEGATLFINLLPCPSCARMLASTGISEVIYTEDHSAGYAIKMLEGTGKIVRHLI